MQHGDAVRHRHLRGRQVEESLARASRPEVEEHNEVAAAQLGHGACRPTHAHVNGARRLARHLERLGYVLELQRDAQRSLGLLLSGDQEPQDHCERD